MDEDEESESFLTRPVEISVKMWHILAVLGAGGLIAFLILRKKNGSTPDPTDRGGSVVSQPTAQQQPAAAKPAGATGTSGFVLLGEQDEPLYDGHPLVGQAREYASRGWSVFKVPTGDQNVMKNRQRFDVQAVYAAPPGHRLPRQAEPINL